MQGHSVVDMTQKHHHNLIEYQLGHTDAVIIV